MIDCAEDCPPRITERLASMEVLLADHIKACQEANPELAQAAARAALELVYTEVGRSTVKAILWIIGAGVLALLAWLGLNGHLK